MSKWAAPTATVLIVGGFIFYFFGRWIWSAIVTVINFLVYVTVGLAKIIISIVVAVFSLISHWIITIMAFAVVGLLIIAAIGFVTWVAIKFAQLITEQLKALGDQIKELKFNMGESAKDGVFLALVAILCSLVAYMGTDDFLDKISSIRFFSAGVIGLVVAKLFMFFPWRITKWCGMFLTFLIIAGSIGFVVEHYNFSRGLMNGLVNMRDVALNPDNEVKALLLGIIATLAFLTLLYPFTLGAWRQLLSKAEVAKGLT
jgi:hypothetical protein